MKLTKIVTVALVAMLLVFAVSCAEANTKGEPMTISIRAESDGRVVAEIKDIPSSIKTWKGLIDSKYNHFEGIVYGSYATFDRLAIDITGTVGLDSNEGFFAPLYKAKEGAAVKGSDPLLKDLYTAIAD